MGNSVDHSSLFLVIFHLHPVIPGINHVDEEVDYELDDLEDHGEGDAQVQRDGPANRRHQGAVSKLKSEANKSSLDRFR